MRIHLESRWASLIALFLLAIGPSSAIFAQEQLLEPTPEGFEFFEREVRPLLLEHCSSCHSASVGNVKGGLSLDTRSGLLTGGDSGEAIVPGKPDESLLVEAIRRESYEMPPEKPLSNKVRLTLEKWVAMGAPWPSESSEADLGSDWLMSRAASHWAWRPVKSVDVPRTLGDDWSLRPLDRFILEKLQAEQVKPAGQADTTTLLRRLCFDLTGLPPTVEQTAQFADLSDPEEYSQLVEQLLASPQFGVRWGRHWLDLMRYAETLGHEFDYPIHHAWQYRDYVVDGFNSDLSYNAFLTEHLAGDLLDEPRMHPTTGVNQSLAATAWLWLGDSMHAPVDIKNDWALRLDNQIDVFSKAFLGMTVACARCHDHKFDAIGVDDYYGLSGIFESSRREYAITDPTGKIRQQQQQIAASIEEFEADARDAYAGIESEQLSRWIDDWGNAMSQLAPAKRPALPASSPLIAMRLLLENDEEFGSEAVALRQQIQRQQTEFCKWENESELYADFARGLPEGWGLNQIDPPAVSHSFDWSSDTFPLPARHNVFSSQLLGRKRSLELRSPTFDVSRTHVCLKASGKGAQSSVVVSNYFMLEFHQLLYKDLRKTIDQPNESGWVTHAGDLNKYIGHPAYLSFDDSGAAWFELEEVWFADRPPPLEPHGVALRVLNEPIETRVELKDRLLAELKLAFDDGPASDVSVSDFVRALVRSSRELHVPVPIALESKLLREHADKLKELDAQLVDPTILLATTEGTGRDALVAIRGNPHVRGEPVPRGCMMRLVSAQAAKPNSTGRAELAKSLVDRQHPLTARVMVNRVWQHMMGRGLVGTPDNFGVLGGRPTHPELLDYLAEEFVANDWSVKWLVREIAVSQTYKLSSSATAEHHEQDADGQLWSHRPVRRLSAEAIRDAMLATANSLDRHLSGPSTPVFLTDKMTGRGRPAKSGPLDGDKRRTLFVEVRRNFLNPFLMAFDFPMPSTAVGSRNASNVPAQALSLLNDPLVTELAKRWAASCAQLPPRDRAELMLRAAYSRPPTADEVKQCLAFAGDEEDAWSELAHVLLNSKEFSFLK